MPFTQLASKTKALSPFNLHIGGDPGDHPAGFADLTGAPGERRCPGPARSCPGSYAPERVPVALRMCLRSPSSPRKRGPRIQSAVRDPLPAFRFADLRFAGKTDPRRRRRSFIISFADSAHAPALRHAEDGCSGTGSAARWSARDVHAHPLRMRRWPEGWPEPGRRGGTLGAALHHAPGFGARRLPVRPAACLRPVPAPPAPSHPPRLATRPRASPSGRSCSTGRSGA